MPVVYRKIHFMQPFFVLFFYFFLLDIPRKVCLFLPRKSLSINELRGAGGRAPLSRSVSMSYDLS